MLLGVVAVALALSMAIVATTLKGVINFQYLMVGGGAALFVLIFLNYLQSGSSGKESSKILEFRAELALLSDRVEELSATRGTDEELSKLFEDALDLEVVKEKIASDAVLAVKNDERERISDTLSNLSTDIVYRLAREISDMRLRSNLNLVFGMFMAVSGLVFLWWSISMVDPARFFDVGYHSSVVPDGVSPISARDAFISLIPRMGLVLFVEFFAYFFLRLYRSSLWEIKYIQNEITNIEAKMIPVHVAWIRDDEEALGDALKSLSKTERNFVLEKGQTTVELEKAKASNAIAQQMVKAVPSLLRRTEK